MKPFIYFLLIAISLSCKKQLKFKIEGTIFDKSLQKNLNGGRLTITKVEADGTVNNSLLVDTQISSDGKYSVSFDRDKALKYIIKIEKENYFTLTDEINFDELSAKKTNTLNYDIYAKGWVKFHTINNFPSNSTDVFTFHFLEKVKNCAECCNDDKVYINGAVENTFYCLYEAGKTYNLRYTTSSPFEQTDFSITTVAFDTIEFYKAY